MNFNSIAYIIKYDDVLIYQKIGAWGRKSFMKLSIKHKGIFVFRLVLILILLYVVFLFVIQFVKIKNKQDEIKHIEEQIQIEKNKTDEISNMLNQDIDSEKAENVPHRGTRVYENVVR